MSDSISPKVSIIVPAYNAETYIVEAIKSALNQSFRDLEVVVVDDGSTDNTAYLVNQIKDSRVRIISQENQGQSVAINRGIKCSSGEYIKLLDADDWLNPAHIQSQLKAISSIQGRIASCRWGYFVNDYAKPAVHEEYTNKSYDDPMEWLVDSLTRDEGMMGGWMWLIPRHIWDKAGGYDPRLSLNNDFHFSIQLLLASNGVSFSEDAIYSYRKGDSGALSATLGKNAMESAYLTTLLGTTLLLEKDDSPAVRKICADRFQQWLFKFYPEYPELALKTERRIRELGGSDLVMHGGKIFNLLNTIVGWKKTRKLQVLAYSSNGWQRVMNYKAIARMKDLS